MNTNTQLKTRDGVARCARYAFGPNKLHLCGPDVNREVLSYIQEGVSDLGLQKILSGFATLYPYLKQIADENHIADPFDDRVVHAYWIGNGLLETIRPKTFFRHLAETLRLKDRYSVREFSELALKLPRGARMHHSFHVLNAYKRTGHDTKYHDINSMDLCRVSWGRVTQTDGLRVVLMRKALHVNGHHIFLGDEEPYTVMRKLQDFELDDITPGDFISLHWNVPCEIITAYDVASLEYYTLKHIQLANLTL